MNKHLHRIIFNAARGARMVVQETARSTCGGKASGATVASVALLGAAFFALPASAQIAGDPNAPGNQRPTVLSAPNGVPLVNIQAPSAGGVSRNTYRQFDVNREGAILNNSRTSVQTQQGGWVQGNPWLARGPARIILNEVNSTNPSQLRGFVEVAGQRAEVIIANPAGIQVDGGGFINASRATLTTGTPQFNAAGSLESFLVRGGTVTVEGAGLDARQADYTAILARAVQVNAGIWASELKVVAGANTVAADASSATPTAGSGAAPTFALDVAQLGGMYAGKIVLVGTEAGVGVRNAGSIGAGAGGLVVTAAGRLENVGTLEGPRIELASASDIDNRGGTIRQTGMAGLNLQTPNLSNTNGGVIGAEPMPVSDPGSGGSTPAPAPAPAPGAGGQAEASAPPVAGTGTGSSGSAANAPPAPGVITAGGTVRNDGGRIYAGGPIALQAPNIDNSGGTLSVSSLAVSGPRFSNAGGTLNVAGSFNAQVGEFANAGGRLHAGTIDIGTSGDILNGDGQLRSDGDITLTAEGMLRNSGSITAGRHLGIQAGSVHGDAAGTLGAGVKADGNMGTEGDLRITTTRETTAQGNNVAAGSLNVQAFAIDLSGGQARAASIALGASQGDVNTSRASVVTPGTLAVTAGNTGARWINDAGTVQAQQLDLAVANLRNTQGGEIVQTGSQSLKLEARDAAGQAGTIDNSGGRLASNGQDLALRASTILNAGGKIEHTAAEGTLSLTADTYSGAKGTVSANGALVVKTAGALDNDGGHISAQRLDIEAGSLGNRGGELSQTGAQATRIAVKGLLDNAGGTIASNADTQLSAASVGNRGGTLRTAGQANLALTVEGQLDNSAQGSIASAGQATLRAGTLANDWGRLAAVQGITLHVKGSASNAKGSILANGAVDLRAVTLDNTGGTVAAIDGDLNVTASGATVNVQGKLQAGGQAVLQAQGGLDNTRGQVSAQQLRVDTAGASLDNSQGTMFGAADTHIDAGALTNDTGFIQSGGVLFIDTHGQGLRNTNAAGYETGEGGISSTGALTLVTGTLDNRAGFIGASGALQATTTGVTNAAGGLIQSASTVEVRSGTGSYDNRGGQTLSGGALRLQGARIDNRGALVRATDEVQLVAGQVDNGATLDAANPFASLAGAVASTGGGSASAVTGHGIEGGSVALIADEVDNSAGAIRAGTDIRITGGIRVNNSAGLIAANNQLQIVDPNAIDAPAAKTLAITNEGGLLVANSAITLDASRLDNAGTITTGQDLSIALRADYAHRGELSANGNLTLATAGKLSNSGKLAAGQTLTVSGQDIDNSATGEMSGRITQVIASGALTNRGLIDGDVTRIEAGTLTNIGTGRIYGRELSIAAGTLDNLSETLNGQTQAGTIAARERLDIGAQAINNRDGALIYSDGDMAIGGALDSQRRATGAALVLNNHAATIESAGNMAVSAAQLNNTNGGVSWTMQPGTSQHVVEYAVSGSAQRWEADKVFFARPGGATGEWTAWSASSAADPMSPGEDPYVRLLLPAPQYPLERFAPYYTQSPSSSADRSYRESIGGGESYTEVDRAVPGAWYARDNPIWAAFEVTPPAADLPATHPGRRSANITVGLVGLTYYVETASGTDERLEPFEHPVTQAEYDEWQAYRQAHQALDAATLAFLQTISGNRFGTVPTRMYKTYDAYDLNVSSSTPVLQGSAPGKIVAGGTLDITVGAGRNEMSQLLAGGTLAVKGGQIVNVGQDVDAVRTTQGTAIHSFVQAHSFKDDDRRYEVLPYDLSEPTTVTLAAARQEGNQAVAVNRDIEARNPGQASATVSGGGGSVNATTRVHPIVQVPSRAGGGTAASGAGADGSGRASAGAQLVVRTTTPSTGLPTASLFQLNANGRYLVETDPRFANYRAWLSSDYLLNNLGLDPNTTQKRLGDGYYEQRLVREQVAQLTGYRYLGDFTSDEAQYTALMNAGATFAQQYGLRPGIALTPEQMAQLTSDIVWLVEQSITLPDGSVQRVLVPQVYVRVQPGDIDGSGALLSGKRVDMSLAGDVRNGGTIAGRQAVSITAQNIQNLGGRITGGSSVDLVARDNIEVIGGRVEAGDRLTAKAGGNLNVQSTTRSATSSTPGVDLKSTYVDRVAGLYVTHPGGELKLTADKNITLKGAEVKSAGSVTMDAGVDLNLETLTTGNAQELHWSAKNSRQDLRVQEVGSTVQGARDVTLGAGRDVNARAATLSAGEDATLHLQAGRHLTLEAGVNQLSSETHHKNKSGINYFTQDASSTQTSLDRTALKAGRIELQSTMGDTTLSAIEANAKSLDIQAGGQLLLQTASTVEQSAQHITHGSAATVGAQGKGSTDETLHYNQLNVGQLSIDAKGGIQAQAGQHVRLDELAQQPGMAWVDQIRNDPKLANSAEWQRVEEAHEKWQYRQSGMGPVSTALVAVMVGVVAAPAAAAAGAAAGGAAGGAAGSTLVGTVVGGAVQSGVLALSNQVAISFFNNHGDLGAVFDELGSKESVRNLATAIVTGGVLAGMGFVPTGAPEVAGANKEFLDLLANNLKTQAASALIRSAINGTSVEDGLQQALLAAVLNTVAAKVAGGIGDLNQGGVLNTVTHKIAHAMAGCALGAAKAGDKGGCAPGAIGAVVGEMMAEAMKASPEMNAFYSDQDKVYMAGLFGGLAAGVAGGDQEAITVGNWAGSNAAANNRMAHQDEYDFAKKHAKLTAAKLHISEQEAEGRIVAEILRNSDKGFAVGTGGIHDYALRGILGCGVLNCNGYKNDPNYANSSYNSEYISANQDAFDAGLSQLTTGKTYNELVASNVKNDPVGAAVAGAGLVGLGYVTGGGGAVLGVKLVGGGVGAVANWAFQPTGQPIDWIDVSLGGVTGFLTTGAGMGSSVLTNVGGSLIGSGIKSENPNAGLGSATVGTLIGYGVGKGIEIPLINKANPWWRPDWIDVGLGISKSTPPSSLPGVASGVGSSFTQESTGNAVKDQLQRAQNK